MTVSQQIPVGLAPMEGVTDFATRLWFKLASQPPFVGTPFLRITEHFPVKRIEALFAPEILHLSSWSHYRVVPQLMTASADDFCRIAEHLLTRTEFVDLNCGCPAPTVVGNGAGSAILQNAERFHAYISTLTNRLGPGRLSVKMRLGFASDAEFAHLFAGIQDLPLAQLQIHGRTRTDRYSGRSRWQPIAAAAARARYPVVASGDIRDLADYNSAAREFPAISAYLIGRGALRQPWIFRDIRRQTSTALTADTLVTSLSVFGLLQNLQLSDANTLIDVAPRLAAQNCNDNPDAWALTKEQLLATHGYTALADVPYHPHALGRAKMLWNYLRSSLPAPAFAPLVFRSKTLPDFVHSIAAVLASVAKQDTMPLRYNREWDWLYAGEKAAGLARMRVDEDATNRQGMI